MVNMTLDQIYIYRMTHIENIPHILNNGITHSSSINANKNYKAIGDLSVIDKRMEYSCTTTNGNAIILGEYIPFYFGVRMPMLYVIQHGGNYVPHPTKAEDIVYIACGVANVAQAQNEYYFTNGHAIDKITKFYDKTHIFELPNIIDWNAVKATYWGGNDNLLLKCKKQAEFLAKSDISVNQIHGFACYNIKAKENLVSLGIAEDKIKIKPDIYY